MWLARWKYSSEEFSLVCLNAVIAAPKVSGSLAEKDRWGWTNLKEHQSGCWSVNQTREGHQTQAAPESWRSLKARFPPQSPTSANNDDIQGLQQPLDTSGIQRQPSSAFISATFSARTHVSRSVGADVQQDGTQVGEDVFFGHVELRKGNILSS